MAQSTFDNPLVLLGLGAAATIGYCYWREKSLLARPEQMNAHFKTTGRSMFNGRRKPKPKTPA